jgi:hypothetical protein
MGNMDQQRGKNKPPHRGGGEDARKQHAPSRNPQGGGNESDPRRGAHHAEPSPERQPEPEFPEQERIPSEELSTDEDRD